MLTFKRLPDKQPYNLKVITPATIDPVTLAETKTFSRITGGIEDDLLTSLITAATKKAENYCGSGFINRTLRMTMDCSPWGSFLELPIGPLVSISDIKSVDDDDSENTFDTSNYYIANSDDTYLTGVQLKNGSSWPTDLRDKDAFFVEFVAGFGASQDDIPDIIKTAIKIIVEDLNENRENVRGDIPRMAKDLLNDYKNFRI
ncbi:MAG: hypothetical protein DRH26_16300 [Deltaproteobacteria bacterium]|nr:MAG: hypothetical protein DRH26_16300 [Deltaproteobacteria bacterium]